VRAVKAFSLLELTLTVGLSALLLGMAVVNLWPARTSANSRSLADSLAEELRLAGRLAIASGAPVGVALPTGGTGPHCQAVYLLTGEQKPHLERVRSFAQEFGGTFVCVGTWPTGAGSWTRTAPQPMSNSDGWNSVSWVNPVRAQDPVLIFTPAGTVTSNGMPRYNGNFCLVTSQGVRYQATSVTGSGPALAYYQLQNLAKPYTVLVSPAGAVEVQPGLPGGDGTTLVQDRSLDTPPGPAAPALTARSNADPVIIGCTLFPEPPDGSASGVATLGPDEHLLLRVTAADTDGDRLFCNWTGSDGVFSSSAQDRMELEGNQWVSNWEWRPPAGVQSGAYRLTCIVRDERGAQVVGGAQGSVTVNLQNGPSLIFGSSKGGILPKEAHRIHVNGSGETVIAETRGMWASDWRVSSNGTDLMYTFGGLVWACHTDGSGRRVLNFTADASDAFLYLGGFFWGTPCFSPDGTQMVCPGVGINGNNSCDLFISDLKGFSFRSFTNGPDNECFPAWSGDGRLIVFQREDSGNSEICFKLLSGGGAVSLTDTLPGNQTMVGLCPSKVSGHYRLLYRDENASPPLRVMDFDADGTVVNPVVGSMGPFSSWAASANLSVDGSKVAYSNGFDIFLAQADGSNRRILDSGPGGSYCDYPLFTPDGSQVIFWSNRGASTPWNGDLYRVRTDGTNLSRITRGHQVLTRMMIQSGWDLIP